MSRQVDATAPCAPRDREFALKGYYGTSAEAIAKRVGVTRPYLFRLFPGGKAIAAAVTRSMEERPPGVRERGQKDEGTSGPPAPWAAQWRSVTRGRSRRTLKRSRCRCRDTPSRQPPGGRSPRRRPVRRERARCRRR
ncbi:helix-turn-helix domain-containing protein [Streptomyces sp. NPDC002817]